jgi:hypothetical protein
MLHRPQGYRLLLLRQQSTIPWTENVHEITSSRCQEAPIQVVGWLDTKKSWNAIFIVIDESGERIKVVELPERVPPYPLSEHKSLPSVLVDPKSPNHSFRACLDTDVKTPNAESTSQQKKRKKKMASSRCSYQSLLYVFLSMQS